jgi:hypothetical protein
LTCTYANAGLRANHNWRSGGTGEQCLQVKTTDIRWIVDLHLKKPFGPSEI